MSEWKANKNDFIDRVIVFFKQFLFLFLVPYLSKQKYQKVFFTIIFQQIEWYVRVRVCVYCGFSNLNKETLEFLVFVCSTQHDSLMSVFEILYVEFVFNRYYV